MPGSTRREQNRIAQRNFRQRKIEKARKTERELEAVQTMYNALLQEHKALKAVQAAPESHPRQASGGVSDHGARHRARSYSVVSVQSELEMQLEESVSSLPSLPSLPSVQSLHSEQLEQWVQSVRAAQSAPSDQQTRSAEAEQPAQPQQSTPTEQTIELFDFAKEFESSLLPVQAGNSLALTPVEDGYQCGDAFAVVPRAADVGTSDLSWDEVSAPPHQSAGTRAALACEPAVDRSPPFPTPPANPQTSLCWPSASGCAATSTWPDLPDLPEIVTWKGTQCGEPCNALSAPPPPQPLAPSFDCGLASDFAGSSQRFNLVDAVLQAGAMQERLAYYELETAKMRASQWTLGRTQVG
ncbi:hypothetical protein N0V87_010654 [Didymella glomerata]|uniref:BZIP domain-containing protein n=1 Tax=Didymella glomerata TaxID=749621 RepID=A0A9W8WPD2_9PLEO|nr:hypothetical protein N0V87_010654 [Didymella glomerata]